MQNAETNLKKKKIKEGDDDNSDFEKKKNNKKISPISITNDFPSFVYHHSF